MPLFKCSASKAKPKDGIRYITDQNKAAFVSAKNLFEDEDYAKQFEETAKRFGKGEKFDERKYYHFKLSCARKDNVTSRRAHDFAEEVAEAFFKNYECVIATHTDTETVHSHIIVNAVDPITGKKLQFGKAEYAAMKDEVNRIGKEHGYTETDFRKRSKNSRTSIEKKIITPALSGIMRCSTCGATMEYHRTTGGRHKKPIVTYECGLRNRYGADKCTKHYINGDVIHKIILDDIRAKAKIVAEDEEGIRKRFIRRNAMLAEQSDKETAKAIKTKRARIAALDDLMSKAYEDKLLGKMPEELCMKFIDRYLAEQENLRKEVSGLEAELRNAKDMRENIDEFMSRIKKYLDVTVITREMMLELFDKIIIGEKEPPNGAPRLIQLVYKVDIDSVL